MAKDFKCGKLISLEDSTSTNWDNWNKYKDLSPQNCSLCMFDKLCGIEKPNPRLIS
jgi:hypothetical protein